MRSDYGCSHTELLGSPAPVRTAPPLSDRRKKVLENLLPAVVPSRTGSARFDLISRGITPDSQVVLDLEMLGRKYTTCGHLVAYVAERLGGRGTITTGVTNGLRDAGQEKGVWTTPGPDKLPSPGDLYALCYRGVRDVNAGISHVGVIVEVNGTKWLTADAGQGEDGFTARYVNRIYDPNSYTLSDEYIDWKDPRQPRLIAGWIDIDAYFAPPAPPVCKIRY